MPASSSFLWTPSQRRALVLLLCIFGIFLAVQFALNRQYLSDDPSAPPPRANDLANRIDPNSADWQTLAAIPTLGQNRAKEIVSYRERFHAAHGPQQPAFQSAADLMHIRGIGQSTASNLQPYLIFPSTAPSSTLP